MAEINETTAPPEGVAAVPRPAFRLIYGQKDITNDITPYVTSVSYTDHLSGESDGIDV